jgi:uncharacterized repeat protein (TIGR01451 family)/CSLREA domain-containing protein
MSSGLTCCFHNEDYALALTMANTLGKNSQHTLPRKNRSSLAVLLPALAMLCFIFSIAPGAQAVTYEVTKTADTNDGACDADCSLREAIRAANASVGVADTIHVPAGTYTLTLTGPPEDAAATGDLDITDTVTIRGNGAAKTIIQAGTTKTNGIDKVFSVNQLGTTSASATFNGVTIRFGRNISACDFTTTFAHLGAGIDFFGGFSPTTTSLTITNSVITDNTVANACAPGGAAGVNADDGNLTITNSTITNNKTTNQTGGGVSFFGNSRTMVMTNTTVSNNEAHGGANGEGGGLFLRQNANGKVEIHNSTISNNTSESRGGGIKLESTPGPLNATIDQRTRITGNTSSGTGAGISEGGGVDISTNGGTTTLKDVTITNNHADNPANSGGKGGGIFLNLGTLNVSLSRIAGNTAPMGGGLFVAAGTVTAVNNWWGCDDFPNATGCDTVSGTSNFNPRLDLLVTATPSTIMSGDTSSVKADVSKNSAGAAVTPVVLNGLPITFSATNGTMSPPSAPLASFMATSTYTNTSCPSIPPAMVMATLDNGTGAADVTINNCNSDLAISKTDNPDPVEVGNNLTYTMAVENNGPSNATGVTMTDTLPAGVTFVSATPSQGTCTGTSTVTCALGSLAVGPIATVTLVVTPTAPDTITNTATVTGNETDLTPANNTATEQTTVTAPTTTTTLPPTTTTTLPPTTTTTTTLPPPPLTCAGRTPTIVGTSGPDTITGTNGNDVIHGLGGNDTINGGNGDDVICGGDGNDTLNGGNSQDRLFGENGNDVLRGDNGNDNLDGGAQTDTCNGGNGTDTAASCESVTSVP